MRSFLLSLLLVGNLAGFSQRNAYRDSIRKYQQNYVETHEVVKGADRKYLKFFPVNKQYKVTAQFKKSDDTVGLIMKTSGKITKKYYRYGTLTFSIHHHPLQLTIYQSEQLMQKEEYKNYLFVPFTDLNSGVKSYGGGKYLDFLMDDIRNNTLEIDFNKAYNPYCAYVSGYNCPIPPRENDLPVAIMAGEMMYGKAH